MAEETNEKPKPKLTLSLGAGKGAALQPRGPKTVTVEVRKRRVIAKPGTGGAAQPAAPETETERLERKAHEIESSSFLTEEERKNRLKALQHAIKYAKEEEQKKVEAAARKEEEKQQRIKEGLPAEEPQAESASQQRQPSRTAQRRKQEDEEDEPDLSAGPIKYSVTRGPAAAVAEDEESASAKAAKKANKLALTKKTVSNESKKGKLDTSGKGRKITVTNFDQEDRQRSLASVKRAREKARRHMVDDGKPKEKLFREVIIPETITVGELANRMSEKSADIVRSLMKLGVMATINQNIDADTAELIVTEFGHKFKRVTDADVEKVIEEDVDSSESLVSRPPVVTIMGHVDHGKTSLLDALRSAKVAEGEAGGITQHIGSYQVELPGKGLVTFIDTPGHEAFTEMRARGAKVTDIVVLVVAADDGIMAQTVEAINHAKAAGVPIIVAINKIDKPDANPTRVRNELLQHELVSEELGGDILTVEVSAKQRLNLDKLLEAILLQAEMLDLKANPDRSAIGSVIESRIDKGRGVVATVIVQRGTLRIGDIVVAGLAYGRVRALLNDRLETIKDAGPSSPVEILGLSEAPMAGEQFSVVSEEKQAREIVEYRLDKAKKAKAVAESKTAMDRLFAGGQQDKKRLAVVIKGDVQGSIEAIAGSLEKITNDEVEVKVIHSAAGAVTESDVTLANASNAMIIAFNVRANAQAREMAHRDKIEIRYYSIIYQVVDEVKAALTGLLSPIQREQFIGYAEIRDVFNITKVGKVAGCYVTEGFVKRGAGVRLLRDNVVIHEGKLKTLKRFKDEVKEVQQGYECGMAFENYDDIKKGDVIECYEIIQEAAKLTA